MIDATLTRGGVTLWECRDLEERWAMALCEEAERAHDLAEDLETERQLASAKRCPWCTAPLHIACDCRDRNPPAIEVVDVEMVDAAVAELLYL